MILYTIGFQGAQLPDFLHTLERHGVDLLVDVRDNANTRKSGFSKTALQQALAEVGIGYVHYRGLGTPSPIRKAYAANPDWDWLKRQYLAGIQTQPDLLRELMQQIYQHTCCLMCYEADPAECHRSILTDYLHDQLDPEIEVRHLMVDEAK